MAYTRSSARHTNRGTATGGNGLTGPRTTQHSRVKPSLMARLTGRKKIETTTVSRETHTVPTHNRGTAASTTTGGRRANRNTRTGAGVGQRRRVSIGDKISGAMMRLKGSLTHRPGEKAAGTRRMEGTDGRGSRRVY